MDYSVQLHIATVREIGNDCVDASNHFLIVSFSARA